MTILQHLHSRYLDTSLHTVWVNENEGAATLPLWNLSGQLVGYQRYRPNSTKERRNDPREGRYFTRVKESRVGVWGLESWKLSSTLFITEGIFDAARISYLGYAAVATLSSNISPSTSSWLAVVRSYRFVVAVCDNDAAGRSLSKYGTTSHIVESYKDLGEASESYVLDLVAQYS